jgi:hypothetical protein
MTIRTTFALDEATEGTIQRLAKLWKTSKAEVVRRSVAEAERTAVSQGKPSPLEALDWLQANGTLTPAQVEAWSQDSRIGWKESWQRRAADTPAKSAPKSKNKK